MHKLFRCLKNLEMLCNLKHFILLFMNILLVSELSSLCMQRYLCAGINFSFFYNTAHLLKYILHKCLF